MYSPSIYMDAGDPNSGFPTSMVSALTAESSPRLCFGLRAKTQDLLLLHLPLDYWDYRGMPVYSAQKHQFMNLLRP